MANLSFVPSHILLSNTDMELTTAKDHREDRLKTELDKMGQLFLSFHFPEAPSNELTSRPRRAPRTR